MAATVQGKQGKTKQSSAGEEPEAEAKVSKTMDNPLYDVDRMNDAVKHANLTAMSYGVEILSINILSAVPIDNALTKALACGAVASAQALQAETAARGNAKATRIDAEGNKKAADLLATSKVAVDLARMDKSAQLIGKC